MILKSDGIFRPGTITTMSPFTSCDTKIVFYIPYRITLQYKGMMLLMDYIVWAEFLL